VSNSFTCRIFVASAVALTAFAAEAVAQCKGGGRGGPGQQGGQTIQRGLSQQSGQLSQSGSGLGTTQQQLRGGPGRSRFLQTQQTALQQQQQQPGIGLQQQPIDPAQSLQTARQRQQQLTDLVTTLQGMQDEPRLNQARQKRLRSAATAALETMLKHDDLLSSLEAVKQQKGTLGLQQLSQLSGLLTQQTNLISSLDVQRVAAQRTLDLLDLQAKQKQ
jgi:hypothetical protein